MIILNKSDMFNKENSCGIGLGNFDGVHLAHEELIKRLVEECKNRDIPSVIYTFRDHPDNILKKRKIKLISTLEKRIEKFKKLGVDYLVLEEFDEDYSIMEPEDFVKNILVDKFGTQLVVTGFNYHFGALGKGDVALLSSLGKELKFSLVTIQPVKAEGLVVSSSSIREFIKSGKMDDVQKMLGEYYSISGKVEYGNKIGTLIGFPTANILPVKNYALPASGVYFTKTKVDKKDYYSITNIGVKPTVTKVAEKIIETHIFDFSGWLYGKVIEVSFISKYRDEIKHSDISELKNRIAKDITEAEKYFKERPYL